MAFSEHRLHCRRCAVGQRRPEIDEVAGGPRAVQHLLRSGEVNVVIVWETRQRQKPERRGEANDDEGHERVTHQSSQGRDYKGRLWHTDLSRWIRTSTSTSRSFFPIRVRSPNRCQDSSRAKDNVRWQPLWLPSSRRVERCSPRPAQAL